MQKGPMPYSQFVISVDDWRPKNVATINGNHGTGDYLIT